MSGKIIVRVLLLLLAGVLLIIYGCGKNRIAELKKEKLFSIPIGNAEEQIGVRKSQNGEFHGPGAVLFRNGFFFIVDSVNQKIMKVTTPGDVILVISKGDDNAGRDTGTILRTKERKNYNFDTIGQIAVDNENNLYVQNIFIQKEKKQSVIDIISLDENGNEEGAEYTESFMSYIVKFDRLGNYQYRIGKKGIDSKPFFYIYKITTDINGDLIVLTADEAWENWTYYIFDMEGSLIKQYTINKEEILGSNTPVDRVSFVMDVCPEVNEKKVVYWVSQYETANDTKSLKKAEDTWGEEIEIENFDASSSGDASSSKDAGKSPNQAVKKRMNDLLFYKLVRFDIASDDIISSYTWETGLNTDTTSEFLGIDGKSDGFLWKYIDKNKSVVTIVRPDGTIIAKRRFSFEDDGLWTNIRVAVDGSVYAVKLDDKNAYFYRWRSDELLNRKKEKISVREFILQKIEGFKNANR